MEGADQTRLRAFLGDLRDELHHARTDFDQDVLVLCPGPPDKPDLRRLKQQQRRRSTLRHRPESTPTPSEFEALKQGVAQLTDTSAIEAVEQRMRQAGDPFVTQVACERRRLQLAAGAVQAALARFESAASCVDGSRV